MRIALLVASALAVTFFAGCSTGGSLSNASVPLGKPVLEEPTLHSLGAYWIIRGDANSNARVEVDYRQAGAKDWRRGCDFLRVERGHTTQAHLAGKGQKPHEAELDPPADCRIFAGSMLLLEPATKYDIRLRLIDPDGGSREETLACSTIAEPVAPAPLRTWHVVPGDGGGSGSPDDPFKGLAAAELAAKAGDLVLVHKGVYNETLQITEPGLPGKPIVWRAVGDGVGEINKPVVYRPAADGEVVIEGKNEELRYGIRAWLVNDVWFEGFTIRKVIVGISANDSHHVVIRRCNITTSLYGICFNGNHTGQVSNFFVSDNTISGPISWPRLAGVENPGGIYMSGRGHDVCYNRVHGFADGIDLYNSKVCAAIDIHNNDISECTDDGSEMDFSERNTRNFFNRYTNVFQGISEQPIMGGPAYIFRNTLYNVEVEPFKLHHVGTPASPLNWAPSGAMIFHNTIVKKGMPWVVWTPAAIYNCFTRNNLFVGTEGEYAADLSMPAINCDFDYDGFAGMVGRNAPEGVRPRKNTPATASAPAQASRPAGKPYDKFLRWNGLDYVTVADAAKRSPAERHAVLLDAARIFAAGTLPPNMSRTQYPVGQQDLRLSPSCPAVDAGAILPGLNDGFGGKAPDIGAYELGQQPPHYGPRPVK